MWRPVLFLSCVAFAAAVVASRVGAESEAEKTAREALAKVVEKGEKTFSDKEFGTSGRACATCHANPKKPQLHLKDRVGDYPKYDRGEKRVITLGEKIRKMIDKNVRGKKEELGSEHLVAIEAYLMKLNRGK